MMMLLVIIAFIICFFASYGAFLLISRLLQRSLSVKFVVTQIVFSFANAVYLCFLGSKRMPNFIIYLFLFIILLAELLLLYRKKVFVIFSGAALFVFHFLCARACAAAFISLYFKVSLYVAVKDAVFSVWSLILAAFIMLLIMFAYLSFGFIKHFDTLYQSKAQMIAVGTVEMVLLAYQMIAAYSYTVKVYDFWFIMFFLCGAVLSISAHFVLAYHLVMYTRWLADSFKKDILSKRIDRQLIHYESYEKHIEGFRTFRAEYDKLVGDMRHNILKGNTAEAQQLLQKADKNVQSIISGHPNFSNNMLIDSVLWDTACVAAKENIKFKANVSTPSWLPLSELELCCLFINLCSNALEGAMGAACEKQINILGAGQEDWFTLTVENSFSGTVKYQNGVLLTTKPDEELHGMGVKSIIDVLEAHGGFYEIEHNESTFKFTAHLPRIWT